MLSEERRSALKVVADRHHIDIVWPESASHQLDDLAQEEFDRFLEEVVEPKLREYEQREISFLKVASWLPPSRT